MIKTNRHGKTILDLNQLKLPRTQRRIHLDPHSIHGTWASPTVVMSNISIQRTITKPCSNTYRTNIQPRSFRGLNRQVPSKSSSSLGSGFPITALKSPPIIGILYCIITIKRNLFNKASHNYISSCIVGFTGSRHVT